MGIVKSHRITPRLPAIVEDMIRWQEEQRFLSYAQAFTKLVMLGDLAISEYEKLEEIKDMHPSYENSFRGLLERTRYIKLERALIQIIDEDVRKQPLRIINVPENLFNTHGQKEKNMSTTASLVQSATQGAKIMLTYIGLKKHVRDIANMQANPETQIELDEQHWTTQIFVDFIDDAFGILDGHTKNELVRAKLQVLSDNITGREPGHGKACIDYEAIENEIIRNLENKSFDGATNTVRDDK